VGREHVPNGRDQALEFDPFGMHFQLRPDPLAK
jgi:hypothetical protein